MPGKKTLIRAGTILLLGILLAGCGVQREEANRFLKRANDIQSDLESKLGGIAAFPSEWGNLFSAGITAASVESAESLVAARIKDLSAVESLIRRIKAELAKISKLNVDLSLKEYVKLRISALDCLEEYAKEELWVLFKAYEGLLRRIRAGASLSELNTSALEITKLVGMAAQKLDEFRGAIKQAEDFFNEYARGK